MRKGLKFWMWCNLGIFCFIYLMVEIFFGDVCFELVVVREVVWFVSVLFRRRDIFGCVTLVYLVVE